jgi:hypothetical protein
MCFFVNHEKYVGQKQVPFGALLTLLCLSMVAMPSRVAAQSPIVQFINASTDTANLNAFDVYVNGIKTIPALGQYQSSGSIEFGSPGLFSLAIAPDSSQSIAEAFFNTVANFDTNGRYTLFFHGKLNSTTDSFTVFEDINTRFESTDPAVAEVSFVHLAKGAEPYDIVLRSGPMLVGNLTYGSSSAYVGFDEQDAYLDYKKTGTTNIISTYRLSLGSHLGQAVKVFSVGDLSSSSSLRQWVIYPDGFVAPVDLAPICRVQFVNALSSTVDIFKNGTRFADDITSGDAVEYKYVPAGFVINIAICDPSSLDAQNPLGFNSYIFENMVTYTAIAAGSPTPAMYIHPGARESALSSSEVDVLFFNASPSFPAVNITNEEGQSVFPAAAFGAFSNYFSTTKNTETLTVTDASNGNVLGSFLLDGLTPYHGQTLNTYLMQNGSGVQLWVADGTGQSKQLSLVVSTDDPSADDKVVRVAPNPLHDDLNLVGNQLQDFDTYLIMNAAGQVVQNGTLSPSYVPQIVVAELPVGMYLLTLVSDQNQPIHLKFIKK